MTGKLTKADLLSRNDTGVEEINIKELGGIVRIRHITVEERKLLINTMYKGVRDGNYTAAPPGNVMDYQAHLVSMTVVDEAGAPMFTIEEINAMSVSMQLTIDKLYSEAEKINAMNVEEAEKVRKN